MQCVQLPVYFFDSACFRSSLMLFHVVVVFLFITEYYYTVWIYHNVFISSPVHGYLDFTYFLAITNKGGIWLPLTLWNFSGAIIIIIIIIIIIVIIVIFFKENFLEKLMCIQIGERQTRRFPWALSDFSTFYTYQRCWSYY